MRLQDRRGYTLIELVVTMLIIGILAAFGIPQYLQSVETAKADDAVAIVNMIGTTNRMFALDHQGQYVRGNFGAACPAAACDATVLTTACTLVDCKYLANQDWGNKPYVFSACDPAVAAGNCAAGLVSSGRRGAGAIGDYATWRYDMTPTGAITPNGTNTPLPTY